MSYIKKYKTIEFKYGILIFLIVLTFSLRGQSTDNYYKTIQGQTGQELKAALNIIIRGHIEYPYTSSQTDTWDIVKDSDRDTLDLENVILFYSGWLVNADQEYNNGQGWSREHVWAKSHGDFGTSKGAGTDVHNLKPSDISVNSARGNKDFDWGGESYNDNDGPTDNKSDADSWEPRDAVKGDVARILFYMSVRYEGNDGEPDLELVDQVNTYYLNEPGKGFHGKLSTIIQWHKNDPVDSFEIRRNDMIYTYQNNRNPFIDHPEYVERIWNISTGIDSESKEMKINIYPNPASSFINIDFPREGINQVKLYTHEGRLLLTPDIRTTSRLSVQGYEPGVYFLQIVTGGKSYQEIILIK